MEALTIRDAVPAQIPFVACRTHTAGPVWVRRDFFPVEFADDRKTAFCKQFSYAVPESVCFGEFSFDPHDRVELTAERYGGLGVGLNGGAGRCGNLGSYQIKGVGRTPLVGREARSWYSYGGLNARDAIYEAMYAQVLDQVLPLGAAKVFGIILTTRDGAYYEADASGSGEKRGWGALLVREACLRPGHFFPAPAYNPRADLGFRITPDRVRVRDVHRALHAALPRSKDVVSRLGAFLGNCARQFGFARIARLMHGGISPPNLCFDGRWIDLANVGFIGGGQNVGGVPAFYEEASAVVGILEEFIDIYSKYSALDLNSGPLIKYYHEQLDACSRHFLGWLFGIGTTALADFAAAPEHRVLMQQTAPILNAGKRAIYKSPQKLSPTDPVLTLITGLFLSLYDRASGSGRLAPLRAVSRGFCAQAASNAFKAGMSVTFHAASSVARFDRFVRLCAIESMKRTLFAEYFFRGRLLGHLGSVLETDPFACEAFIDESVDIASWVFRQSEPGVSCLYRYAGRSLLYDARDGVFRLVCADGQPMSTHRYVGAVIESVDSWPDSECVAQGYDLKPGVLRLLRLLLDMERAGSH